MINTPLRESTNWTCTGSCRQHPSNCSWPRTEIWTWDSLVDRLEFMTVTVRFLYHQGPSDPFTNTRLRRFHLTIPYPVTAFTHPVTDPGTDHLSRMVQSKSESWIPRKKKKKRPVSLTVLFSSRGRTEVGRIVSWLHGTPKALSFNLGFNYGSTFCSKSANPSNLWSYSDDYCHMGCHN